MLETVPYPLGAIFFMRPRTTPAFKTRREIERYFSGDTIECLICGRHFQRLQTHLAVKHAVAADAYKRQFGRPWTRGLISAASLANSGWTDERKAKARKLARKSGFFRFAHLAPRREVAPFLKAEAIEHLGVNAKGFGEKFDVRVRALAEMGLEQISLGLNRRDSQRPANEGVSCP
jgi:hypothetical protein